MKTKMNIMTVAEEDIVELGPSFSIVPEIA